MQDTQGYKCDSLYLSEDNKWDIKDVEMVDPQCSTANLRSGSPVSYSRKNIPAPLVPYSELYGVVRSRSNIRDFHLENNIGISSATLHVSYPELSLDVPFSHTLKGTSGFIVRSVPFSKTLVITVTSQSGLHDIYARHSRPATAYEYDTSSTYPTSANQESIIPFSKEGDYYILIENTDIGASDIIILVKIAKFEILSVTPTMISTQQPSTMHIRGTMFCQLCDVSLMNDDTEVLATEVYRMSSEDIYATFPRLLAEGDYTIKLVDTVSKLIALSPTPIGVKVSSAGQFTSTMSLQRSMRPGQTGMGRVTIHNSGNTDVTGLLLVLSSQGVGNIQLIHQGKPITYFEDSHTLVPFMESGPAGILRPKSSTTLDFLMGPRNENSVGEIIVNLLVVPVDKDEDNPFINKPNLRVNIAFFMYSKMDINPQVVDLKSSCVETQSV